MVISGIQSEGERHDHVLQDNSFLASGLGGMQASS